MPLVVPRWWFFRICQEAGFWLWSHAEAAHLPQKTALHLDKISRNSHSHPSGTHPAHHIRLRSCPALWCRGIVSAGAHPLLPRSEGLAPSVVGDACSQQGFLQIPSPCQFTLNLKKKQTNQNKPKNKNPPNNILLSKHFYLLPEKWKINTKKCKSISKASWCVFFCIGSFQWNCLQWRKCSMPSSTVATVAICLLSPWCGQYNWGSGFLIFVNLMNLNMHMG